MKEWRDIPGYEREYQVSSEGEIFSISSNKFLKIYNIGTGRYRMVRLHKNGKGTDYSIHRLVARTFLGEPNIITTQRIEVNHINGNKEDNRVENLEWCTHGENQAHAYRTGLKRNVDGEQNPRTKLTNDTVKNAKLDRANGIPRRVIMKRYNLSKSQTDSIFYSGHWQSITV